eukprot:gene4938-5584_t
MSSAATAMPVPAELLSEPVVQELISAVKKLQVQEAVVNQEQLTLDK